eukprot:1699545-Prymnesium_polylepis.1
MEFQFHKMEAAKQQKATDKTSRFVDKHPCLFGRLLIPEMLRALEVVVYIDVDVYVFGDLYDLVMSSTSAFSDRQWGALVSEAEGNERVGWYNLPGNRERTDYPFVQPNGLNSGVFLLNVTRCRLSAFLNFTSTFRGHTPLGDQDVLNAYFSHHREELHMLPCKWNRRIGSGCGGTTAASKHGHLLDGILHGNRQQFH